MRTVLAFTVLLILTVSNTFSKTDKIEGIIRDGVNTKPNSETEIFETSKLLGAFEIMPNLEKKVPINTDEKKEKSG